MSFNLNFGQDSTLIFDGVVCQIAFTSQKDYGKEAREAQWAQAQRTLHGLQPPEPSKMFSDRSSYHELTEIAEQAKRRAEIARCVRVLRIFCIMNSLGHCYGYGDWHAVNYIPTLMHSYNSCLKQVERIEHLEGACGISCEAERTGYQYHPAILYSLIDGCVCFFVFRCSKNSFEDF